MKHIILILLVTTGLVDFSVILFSAGLAFARFQTLELICSIFALMTCCSITCCTLDLYGRSRAGAL